MPNNVMVVGMPRSGTSMLAGVFARKGFFLADDPPRELRDGDHMNPGGYWEASALIDRNVEVFEAAGFPYHNTWMFDPITPDQVERIGSLPPVSGHEAFVAAFEAHTPWLWKDPRLCYTLPYWWRLVDSARTRVLVIRRDPTAIYRSFVRVGWREPSPEAREEVLGRIADHVGNARRAIADAGIPALEVEYADFARDPEGTAGRLSDFLGLSLSVGDLHFDRSFDHSSWKGRARAALERVVDRVPGPVRRGFKAVVPRRLLRIVLPGWKS